MDKHETNERLAELFGLLNDPTTEWDLGRLNLLRCALEQRLATERDRLVYQHPIKVNGRPVV